MEPTRAAGSAPLVSAATSLYDLWFDRLDQEGCDPRERNGYAIFLCPVHGESRQSATLREEGRRILLHCHVCCTSPVEQRRWLEELLRTLGLSWADTMGDGQPSAHAPRAPARPSRSTPLGPEHEADAEREHAALLENEERQRALLLERGITLDVIRRARIGWRPEGARYTIPYPDPRDQWPGS